MCSCHGFWEALSRLIHRGSGRQERGSRQLLSPLSPPILIPALVVGWTVLVLVRGWANPLRAVFGTLPLALAPTIVWWLPRFGAPGDIALLPGIGRFFADPGVGQTGGSADWWWYPLGWPELPGDLALAGLTITFSTFVLWCVVPVLALALAVFATSRSDAYIIFGVTVAVGLATAAMAPFIDQGYAGLQPITVWSGSGVMVVSLGVVAAGRRHPRRIKPCRVAVGALGQSAARSGRRPRHSGDCGKCVGYFQHGSS